VVGIGLAAVAAAVTAWWYALPWVALLCLIAAFASGLAKLAVDAVIQECTDDKTRASAFAHSETLLMLAWVAGGGLGLIRVDGRWALAALAGVLALGLARAIWSATRLRRTRLRGIPEKVAEQPEKTLTDPVPVPPPPREPVTLDLDDDDDEESPGFHIYRPTSRREADA
jgi:hypothetical protein